MDNSQCVADGSAAAPALPCSTAAERPSATGRRAALRSSTGVLEQGEPLTPPRFLEDQDYVHVKSEAPREDLRASQAIGRPMPQRPQAAAEEAYTPCSCVEATILRKTDRFRIVHCYDRIWKYIFEGHHVYFNYNKPDN